MNPMHDHLEEWMAAAITGGLSAEEKKAFEEYLNTHPEHHKLYQEEQMTAKLVENALSPDRPAGDFEDRIVRRFRRDVARKGRATGGGFNLWTIVRRIRLIPITVLLALLITLGGLLTPALHRSKDQSRGAQSYRAGPLEAEHSKSTDKEVDRFSEYATETPPRDEPPSRQAKLDGQIAQLESNLKDPQGRGVGGSGVKTSGYADTRYMKLNEEKKASRTPPAAPAVFSAEGPIARGKRDGDGIMMAKAADAGRSLVGSESAVSEAHAVTMAGKVASDPGALVEAPATSKLIRNAFQEFEIQNFEATVDRIRVIASEESGYIATSHSSRLANGKVRGQVIIKVLPDHLDAFLLKLRALGDLKNQSISTQDVTKAYYDTESRMRNSKRMEERLLKMLDEAKGKVTDLLVVEKELARVRQEIEEMQGQMKVYDSQIAYATVTITLYEKDMNQAAAFLLKECANLGIFSSDVERAFREAKRETEAVKGQILQSQMNRDDMGNASATLRVLVAPENAEALLGTFKRLGRVQSLTWQNERVAQGGTGSSDTARVEKDKVQISLTISHDDASRKHVNLSVVTKGVEEALDKAKAEATVRGAEILSSNLERAPDGHVAAQFSARVPSRAYDGFIDSIKALGRVVSLEITRNDPSTEGGESGGAPVLVSLALTDQEAAMQQTGMSLLADKVEAKAAGIKAAVGGYGAEILSSTFEHGSDGRELANFSFRVPMGKYAGFADYLKGLGQVKDYTVHRQDRSGEARIDAPAEITLQIYSKGNIVGEETGLLATLRKTLGEGMGAMMWSVRMVGVALAFLLPWILPVAIVGGIVWLIRWKRKS